MSAKLVPVSIAFFVSVGLAGCQHSVHPAETPARGAPLATSAPVDQAPPPKCESLEETCIATPGTRTPIGQSGWTIVPPSGWKFAHAATATFASIPDAMIAVTTFDRLNKSQSRETILRELTERVGVTLPARRDLLPKKPHKRQPIGAITLALYQFDRVRRSQHNGVMVVFTTDLPSNAAVLGVAFVASDDRSKGDQAVLGAIESLTPPEAAGPRPERTPTAKLRSSESPAGEPVEARKEDYGLDLHPLK